MRLSFKKSESQSSYENNSTYVFGAEFFHES